MMVSDLSLMLPAWENLPDIPLYMDQALSYLSEKLNPFYPTETGFITSNMVNNYVKNQVLLAPENKKYTKVHLSKLLLIFLLKKAFSVMQIKEILESLSGLGDDQAQYDGFLSVFQSVVSGKGKNGAEVSDELLFYASQAVFAKICAEYLIPHPASAPINTKSDFKSAKVKAKQDYKVAKRDAKAEYKEKKKKQSAEDGK